MNEGIFLVHATLVLAFSLFSLKMGKNALVGFIVIQAFLANFFIQKQIVWFGFTVTCTDVFSIGSLFSFNLLQEYFGKEEAKKAIKITFFLLFFSALMSQIHLFYTPSVQDYSQEHYQKILGIIPRIFFISISVFFFSQYADMQIFTFLKKKKPKLSFASRSFISMAISQLLDTALFTYLALYDVVSSLFHVLVVSYFIKLSIISFNSLFSKYSLKKRTA